MKKIRYSKSRLRVQIGEDGAGIVLEQIDQTPLRVYKSKISPLKATVGDTAERRVCWQETKRASSVSRRYRESVRLGKVDYPRLPAHSPPLLVTSQLVQQ
jgi:hypothetical protein